MYSCECGSSLPPMPSRVHHSAGTVSVVRTQPMSPQPYTGVAELETGEIAEDLTRYLADSEQTNSALALGVKLDSATGKVITAGGYLIQVCLACFRFKR